MAGLRRSFISAKIVKSSKFFILVAGFAVFFTNLYILKTWSSTTKTPKAWENINEQKTRLGVSANSTSLDTLIVNLKNLSWSATPTKKSAVTNLALNSSLPRSLNRSCVSRVNEVQDGIVLFKNITIRPKLARAKVLETHLEHPQEEDEFFVLKKGFFTLYCNRGMDEAKGKLHKAKTRDALAPWVLAFEVTIPSLSRLQNVSQTFYGGHYLAIQRIEYANVYWTIIDLLDIYITTQILEMAPEKLNIILMDAHSPTSLDPFWSVVFNNLIKLGIDPMFKDSSGVVLENLVWRYPRVNSPLLDRNLQSFKHIQPFRRFVLKRFGIPANEHSRNCSQHKIHVLVNFRRDYHTHPRNLEGIVDRKIANEKEILKEMNDSFPNIAITPVQLDTLHLKNQLELVASADVFFGMHGCAHGFPIFMQPGGAVVEIFNFNGNNWHMGKVASLSGHSHITWVMTDAKLYNRKTRSTTIPAGVASELLRKAIQKICA